MLRRLALAVTLLAVLTPAAPAADVPPGAKWSQATIDEPDGTKLHADILRPASLPDDAPTPVIVSIGPYFNHSGEEGPASGDYDPTGTPTGPSPRFYDFVNGAGLMARGYTFVMVDLRGFGGSSGCLDWGGPGEQADVKAAVEWAASQKWSTGRVGLYGKSYDGVTGLIGEVTHPRGLEAVVAMEPVYDLYRYLYSGGVRYLNSFATPALYDAIAATPGPLGDDPLYNVNGVTDPACLAVNYSSQQDSDHGSAFWQPRDLIAAARKRADVPLFMTQGFLEDNTKPDGAYDFFNAVTAYKRAWFGMWDHVRGNEINSDGRLVEGRPGFFDEVMRFYDHFLRGVPLVDAPTDRDPPVAVQTSDGSWRSERQWPPADAQQLATALKPGGYADDGANNGSGDSGTGSGAGSSTGEGIWTISPPLASAAHLGGTPSADLQLSAPAPDANVVVDVYDIAPDRSATLISRNASLIGGDGKVHLDLYGNDWLLPAGHRVGVCVTGSNSEWWVHVPTQQTVTLAAGTVTLPFLRFARRDSIAGAPSVRLESYLKVAPFTLPAETIDAATSPGFALPGPLASAAAAPARPARPGGAIRLRARIAVKRRRVVVYGDAPVHARLAIRLRHSGRTVALRRVRTRVDAFRVTFKVRRSGRYSASVIGVIKGVTMHARSRAVSVR